MKSIKVKPGEPFELCITDDQGNDITKQCYSFDSTTTVITERKNGMFVKMDLVPTLNEFALYNPDNKTPSDIMELVLKN